MRDCQVKCASRKMSPHNCTVNFAVHEKNQSNTSVNINNFKVAKDIQDFVFPVIMICHKQVLPEEIVSQACFVMPMYRVAGKRHPQAVSGANCKSGNRYTDSSKCGCCWVPAKSGRDAERCSLNIRWWKVKPAPLHKKKKCRMATKHPQKLKRSIAPFSPQKSFTIFQVNQPRVAWK